MAGTRHGLGCWKVHDFTRTGRVILPVALASLVLPRGSYRNVNRGSVHRTVSFLFKSEKAHPAVFRVSMIILYVRFPRLELDQY